MERGGERERNRDRRTVKRRYTKRERNREKESEAEKEGEGDRTWERGTKEALPQYRVYRLGGFKVSHLTLEPVFS